MLINIISFILFFVNTFFEKRVFVFVISDPVFMGTDQLLRGILLLTKRQRGIAVV